MSRAVLLLLSALAAAALATNNGVARTPAMGYNTWNDFRCNGISAANIKAVADKMVALGLTKLGYNYVNCDDCWAVARDNVTGRLVPDPVAFPKGMTDVSSYVHSLNLRFGLYTDRGPTTCAGRPASGGNEVIDAQTFADWGVDYLKEDSCNAPSDHLTAFAEYGKMRDALNATGRPIYFSLCGWNNWYAPQGYSLGNSWRIAGDCNGWDTIYNAIRTNEVLAEYAGPGGWNDPDMLVGSSPLAAVHNTQDQARTQFSLWAVMAAPLLIGSNMLNMSAFDLQTYSNTEVIAVDQDPLGIQGAPVVSTCPNFTLAESQQRREMARMGIIAGVPQCYQIWAKKLFDGSVAINMINFALLPATITCDKQCLLNMGFSGQVNVRDLWQHANLPGPVATITAKVNSNGGSVTYKVSAA